MGMQNQMGMQGQMGMGMPVQMPNPGMQPGAMGGMANQGGQFYPAEQYAP